MKLQDELDDGPCLTAYRTGETVAVADLGPTAGSLASPGGRSMVAVFSVPLQGFAVTALALGIGALRNSHGPTREPE